MMKQYLKLLMLREGREVLGKGFSNLWLLTLVLVATFSSIAFSEGSMIFLRDKMEDPFTNWIDIPDDGSNVQIEEYKVALNKPEIQEHYGFGDVHGEREKYYDIIGVKDQYLRCRHFANTNNALLNKILDNSNLIDDCCISKDKLSNNSLGVIVTSDVLHRLGYKNGEIPSYVHFKAYMPEADTLGLKVTEGKFYPVPWPVLAVVRRLPNNVDMMATNFLSEQPYNDNSYPFDFNSHIDYLSQLTYFVPNELNDDDILTALHKILPDSIGKQVSLIPCKIENMQTWCRGRQIEVDFGQEYPNFTTQQWVAFDEQIQLTLKNKGLVRIYNYETSNHNEIDNRISIMFNTLEHIREFEDFSKSPEYKVQIDMSQVASKENFNEVTVMATILSSAIVVFALVCIIMFLVNMLQGYFQKVKRNIGTFKAFGMNAAELIYVYTIILILIVCTAVGLSLLITWGIQIALPHFGIEKDGFNYFALWNNRTYIAACVVVISTVATVFVVMKRMLSKTPGDLIYDR